MDNVTSSKWVAWINQEPLQPTNEGTLHVTGEVDSHSTKFAVLRKKNPQGINEKILLLEIKLYSGIIPVNNPQLLHYSEELESTYSSIEIFYGSQKVTQIADIPVVQ